MKIIVGLGNPGKEYEKTRHNTGFLAIDKLAEKLNVTISKKEFSALTAKTNYKGQQVLLVKPQTYMNNSGEAVRQAVNFYHVDPEDDVLIIYDDLDIKYGQIRLRTKGSAGGHNGIKSIINNLSTQNFNRIRIGIEKSPIIPVVDYVLGKVEKDKQDLWNKSIDRAADAALDSIDKPFDKVMNMYNKVEND